MIVKNYCCLHQLLFMEIQIKFLFQKICLVTPLSVYAKSKFFMEEIVKDWSHLNDNRKVIILRYFNPAGNHYSGEIGEVSRQNKIIYFHQF